MNLLSLLKNNMGNMSHECLVIQSVLCIPLCTSHASFTPIEQLVVFSECICNKIKACCCFMRSLWSVVTPVLDNIYVLAMATSWLKAFHFSQIKKRHSSGSMSEDKFAASAREYVESLHQNSRIHLLYGKNNVQVQPVSKLIFLPRS